MSDCLDLLRISKERPFYGDRDELLSTGILSQAPGYTGTSTTVAIGGLDLPPGNYIVRIKGDNGEEASMPVKVPDYETWSVKKSN